MSVIDIVGTGLLSLVLGYHLQRHGLHVRVWECCSNSSTVRFQGLPGVEADAQPLSIHPDDAVLHQLIADLDCSHALRSAPVSLAVRRGEQSFAATTGRDLAQFGLLSPASRVRLALALRAARQVRDWRSLEAMPILRWLDEVGGAAAVQHLWRPLLRARFGPGYEHLPATYAWTWLLHMAETHRRTGYLAGGQRYLAAMVQQAIIDRGGQVAHGRLRQVDVCGGQVRGLEFDHTAVDSTGVVLALPPSQAAQVLPPAASTVAARWSQADTARDLLSVLLVLRRSLMPFHTLLLADPSLPFSTIIESTNQGDQQHANGYHLVYVQALVGASNVFAQMADEDVAQAFVAYLHPLFPGLGAEDIVATQTMRDPQTLLVRRVRETSARMPVSSTIAGLYGVHQSQVYPHIHCFEAQITYAQTAAAEIAQAQSYLVAQPTLRAA